MNQYPSFIYTKTQPFFFPTAGLHVLQNTGIKKPTTIFTPLWANSADDTPVIFFSLSFFFFFFFFFSLIFQNYFSELSAGRYTKSAKR